MKLYIVRHAIAVPHGSPGFEENDRPLTEDGISKMKRAAKGLRLLEVQPDLVLSSPLPRARQTAEIVLAEMADKSRLEFTECLAPSGSRRDLYAKLRGLKDIERLMLVGHQPSLGEIAGDIAWGSPEHYLELRKGGGCCLDVVTLQPRPRGTLLWVVTPFILRALA